MSFVRLPSAFKPKACPSLIRVGRRGDGGYVLDRRSVVKSDCLISLGIEKDWSFEQMFLSINKVPVFAFDGSVNKGYFKKRFLKSWKTLNLKHIIRYGKLLRSYQNFYDGVSRTHFEKFVCFDYSDNHISFETLIDRYIDNNLKNIFLKVDIEGSEYRILDSILKTQDRLCGLVIEFHDVDINIEKIKHFVGQFNQTICYVHANNFAPINGKIPLALEISFTAENFEEGISIQSLDGLTYPNNPKMPDYEIAFS